MNNRPIASSSRPARSTLTLAILLLLGAGAAMPAYAQYGDEFQAQVSAGGWLYDLGAVISVFVDAPLVEPEPVAIAWAPPPMLVEELPPQPDPAAVWTGGYWTWQGDWVWCAGRWVMPPQPEYVWVQPYYEHRDDRVIFLPGYWSEPNVEFIAPTFSQPIAWAYVGANVVVGPPPMGPPGVFIPPPPGSRPGIIIPAPIGTPPAVVVSAPPVVNVGMSVSGNVTVNSNNTVTTNRVTNYNVTNIRNVTNVVIQAPAGATASGQAFHASVPHQANLAAALKPMVVARAPVPVSRTPVKAYVAGATVAALPPPQHVQGLPQVPTHPSASLSAATRAQMAHPPIAAQQRSVAPAPGGPTPQAPTREARSTAVAQPAAPRAAAEQEQRGQPESAQPQAPLQAPPRAPQHEEQPPRATPQAAPEPRAQPQPQRSEPPQPAEQGGPAREPAPAAQKVAPAEPHPRAPEAAAKPRATEASRPAAERTEERPRPD